MPSTARSETRIRLEKTTCSRSNQDAKPIRSDPGSGGPTEHAARASVGETCIITSIRQRGFSRGVIMKFSLIAVFCFLSSLLYSQDFRGTIEGQVTDQSSSAIPGAAIKITNNQTGEAKDVKSNNQGYYSLPYLNPGNYTIEATASGFETLRQTEIALRVADKLNLPLRMAVGQMSQEVTITGQQEVLDTGSADRGLVFDPLKTEQLPLNGRQEYMLMALTPGVLFTQEQFGASGFSGTRGWDVNSSYKINGARPGENVFLLNGAPISDNGGTWDLAPNIEAVQEFKVMTNTYDAQYGHFGGGAVNTTIKSGGNAYHGDVFDYFRNSYMDANNFGNNYNGQPTPYHNQHQFGGVVGGPVRKNKDFFFASFEGWREVLPAPSTNTVPTADEIAGNFAATPYTIYDPLTSAPCTSATCTGTHVYVRQPFAGDVVPSSRINPVGAKILSYYPRPTIGGFQGNFNAPNVRDQYMYNQPIGRWDHNFGDKDKIYGLATFQHGTENRNSSGFPSPADSGNIQTPARIRITSSATRGFFRRPLSSTRGFRTPALRRALPVRATRPSSLPTWASTTASARPPFRSAVPPWSASETAWAIYSAAAATRW